MLSRFCISLAILALLGSAGCGGEPVAEVTAPAGAATAGEPFPEVAATDAPWWRGAEQNGVYQASNLPLEWSTTENVAWQTPVPGRGHSSPSLWGERIFVSTADEQAQTKSLLCFDRATGKQLWEKVLHQGRFMHTHNKNSQASATPACDGSRVIVPFMFGDAIWVSAVDLDGNLEWQVEAGPYRSQHGYGSSPALYESLVIVAGDNPGSGFLAALDRASGKIVWRIERSTGGNYATPIVANVAGKPQLLIHGRDRVSSYDPATGKEIWHCDGPATTAACTLAHDGQKVFATGGYPQKEIICVKADGQGDVTDSHIVWRSKRGVSYVPSPLYHDGRLYVISDGGVLTVYKSETGDVLTTKRLGGNFTASPVLAGGHLFLTDESGKTYVLTPGDQPEVVAESSLASGGFASPVMAGERIYLRTKNELVCLTKE